MIVALTWYHDFLGKGFFDARLQSLVRLLLESFADLCDGVASRLPKCRVL